MMYIIKNNPYSFLIDDDSFIWSYSRLSCYDRCPYNFCLDYIKRVDKIQNGFAEYGTFVHDLLEKYANGELLIFELLNEYEDKFTQNVIHDFPPNRYVDLAQTYFEGGQEYFRSFEGFGNYEIIQAERKIEFKIEKYPFVGYIDLILKDENGDITVWDHKSKDLKMPQKKRWENVEVRRTTEFYEYLRQLYIYCIPLIEQEDIIPKYLAFNCFRKQKVIKVEFDMNDYLESKDWALNVIKSIYADEKMDKKYDQNFFCNYICGVGYCCPCSNKFLGEEI